jgi:hypothetical protein
VVLDLNSAQQLKVVKDVFLDQVAANVFSVQMHPFVQERDNQVALRSAEAFVAALKESMQPRDALEEMLVLQMAWTHARIANLSRIAPRQTDANNVRVVNDACDRAANTFRRMMLALAEYRRPPRADHFVAIKQANVANQQVVQNVASPNQAPDCKRPNASNEQGSPSPLPTLESRAAVPAAVGGKKQALADELRPADGRGQGSVQAERDEAW